MKKRLTNKNKKVKAWLFSLPPIKSCLNSSNCQSTCYAAKAYRQYKRTRELWDNNFDMARYNIFRLYDELVEQLRKIENSKMKVVRIHQSGDFFSQDYINMWCTIAREFPSIQFYGYTKVSHMLDIKTLNNFDNVNIIDSMIDNKLNYGSLSYVEGLNKEYGTFICPASRKDLGDIMCGRECSYCFTKDNVAFIQH